MKKFNGIFKTCRIVTLQSSVHCNICLPTNRKDKLYISPPYVYINTRAMAQKSIMSFFKVTPKKSSGDTEEKIDKDQSHSDESDGKQSPTPDIKRSSKRLRSNSDESKSPQATNNQISSSPASLEKKKRTKRQRIESSESEPEAPDKTSDSPKSGSECESSVKKEKMKLKTYDSPKSKKAKGNQKIKEEVCSPKSEEKKVKKSTKRTSVSTEIKEEKQSPMGKKKAGTKNSKKNVSLAKEEDLSPEKKENGEHNSSSKTPSPANKSKKENSPPKKKNAFEILRTKRGALDNGNGVTNENKDEDTGSTVPATEYNPAKAKYHPVKDACWRAGEPVPYLALARTLEAIEATSARLKMVDILANYLRSVIALTPEDLLPSVYMCLNQLAPAYHGLELGIAETYLMKAVGQCTGRSLAQMKAAAQRAGDLGRVAEDARATQRTVLAPPPLTARRVFRALKEVAQMTGQASVNKKISKIQSLYVACRQSEARYLIRSLEGKLRVGLAEQSLLQALALAAARTPPAGERAGALDVAADMAADSFKALVDEFALIVKTTYCECPNYELVVPVLLEHGVRALPAHCRLAPGVPLKPMLAHPTKGVGEVFNRFENEQFTCEYKYDGERAQIHVPGHDAPDYARAAVYSRNQENNTSKYPDVLARLPDLLTEKVTSCVLDCEAVAYDPAADQILPFQVLSTRKRKDAAATEIKVQVCVFVFDLLFLNGRALVREPLAERRRLLRDHFRELKGAWQFAVHRDCSSMEEVQQFLDEAVRASCEGLMVKTLRGEHARYDIARRSHNWLKLKKDYLEGVGDTIDAVVVGGYRGRGRRAGALGGYLLACREPAADEYQSLCRLGTGFSDEDLKTLGEALQQHVIDGPKSYYRYDSSHAPDVWFEAACVWEVRCADLSLSAAHRAAAGLVAPDKGVSLRFPRFIRVREDKAPEQATTAQQIAEMYLAQDQVQNTKGSTKTARLAEDDFY